MGMTVKVQEYFKNEIMKVLNKKVEAISGTIDHVAIKNACLDRAQEELNFPDGLFDEVNTVIDEKNRLIKAEEEIAEKVRGIVERYDEQNALYWRYRNPSVDNAKEALECLSTKKFLDIVKREMYPAEYAKLEEIDAMKRQVEAAVMLSTTEKKLVRNLTALLEKFGGSIKEVEALLPELEDFTD